MAPYSLHWLQCWQLRTWINDNLTVNCDTGQHSQLLRCFITIMGYIRSLFLWLWCWCCWFLFCFVFYFFFQLLSCSCCAATKADDPQWWIAGDPNHSAFEISEADDKLGISADLLRQWPGFLPGNLPVRFSLSKSKRLGFGQTEI